MPADAVGEPIAGDAAARDPTRAAGALQIALAEAGLRAAVTADGRLAILAADAVLFVAAEARRTAVSLARRHGFTHVALELSPAADASVAAPAAAARAAP